MPWLRFGSQSSNTTVHRVHGRIIGVSATFNTDTGEIRGVFKNLTFGVWPQVMDIDLAGSQVFTADAADAWVKLQLDQVSVAWELAG